MPRPPKPKTEEAEVLTSAFKATGAPKMAAIADKVGVSPGQISQWASGHRPVPWDKAHVLAVLLGLAPEQISAAYRAAAAHFLPSTTSKHPTSNSEAWQAYEAAPRETRAAVDLLLLPPHQRAAVLATAPPALVAGVDVIERHAAKALSGRKRA